MLALVDLHFAEEKVRIGYNCDICQRNPANARMRKCQEPGFENLKAPRKVDSLGRGYLFCPGKATWYPEVIQTFQECRVALETGLLPRPGGIEDQDEMFCDVFFDFVEHWKFRTYKMIWRDVREMVEAVLKSFSGKKGK